MTLYPAGTATSADEIGKIVDDLDDDVVSSIASTGTTKGRAPSLPWMT